MAAQRAAERVRNAIQMPSALHEGMAARTHIFDEPVTLADRVHGVTEKAAPVTGPLFEGTPGFERIRPGPNEQLMPALAAQIFAVGAALGQPFIGMAAEKARQDMADMRHEVVGETSLQTRAARVIRRAMTQYPAGEFRAVGSLPNNIEFSDCPSHIRLLEHECVKWRRKLQDESFGFPSCEGGVAARINKKTRSSLARADGVVQTLPHSDIRRQPQI
jgi:hypothetical protein